MAKAFPSFDSNLRIASAITYLAPNAKSNDMAALQIAEAILSGGESSRLNQELVYKQQIAQDASFSVEEHTDKGVMYFIATLASGKTPEMAEKSLLTQLKKIQATGVTAKELAKAKNGIIADAIRRFESNDGKAFAIGQSVILQGSAQSVNNKVGQLQAVTAADVKRVMKQYFKDDNRVVIYYVNDETKGAKE